MVPRPSVRTQFLVFTLFGEYLLPRGGTVWTSSLLSLLNLLGVSERAARTTLSRMALKGWLVAKKQGRRSQYSLTPRGWSLLKQGEQRIFEPPFSDWDGLWQVVVYSLPEHKRRLRHALRQRLAWFGFGPLASSTWVSPHDRRMEVKNVCAELDVQEYVDIFSGMHLGPSQDKNMAQRCWNLPDLESHYCEFITRFENEYHECQNNGGLTPETCFARRFWLMYYFQSFPRKDPNLPTLLLPSDWIGFQARGLFDDYRRLLEPASNKFVDGIMGGEGGAVSTGQPVILDGRLAIPYGGDYGHHQETTD